MLYTSDIKNIFVWLFPIIGLLVFGFLFIDSFFNIRKSQTIEEFNKYKNKLSYNDEGFTIHTYSYDLIVKWDMIEAIFLINSPPGDGEYHNKQYRIILNKEPVTIEKRQPKWYDKILPSPKKEKYPEIRIDDYYNIHFTTFHPAVGKYLITGKISSEYLNKKFGNDVRYIQKDKNTIIGVPAYKPVKIMGFYAIFDRGNDIIDERLMQYRNSSK
jgi:hypothetical protein